MNNSNRAILNSWKEIAEYVGRGIRTLQRWERDHGFPVHRPSGKNRSAVFSVSAEVDTWLKTRPLLIENGVAATIPNNLGPRWTKVRSNTHDLVSATKRLVASTGQLQIEMKHAMELGAKYRKAKVS
jgi:phage terminase Nu1 subunit (DNA packaging protein)